MENYRFIQLKYNIALFYNKKKKFYIMIYINNFKIYYKNKKMIKNFKNYLYIKYKIKDLGYILYYLKIEIQ